MKKLLLLLALPAVLAQGLSAQDDTSGLVSFNTGRSPVEDSAVQGVSLFGCHNTQVDASLFWDTEGQVVGHIPYGPRESNGKRYFLSKYYVASPPVFRHEPKKMPPFIGLVIPDRFTFQGERPAQIVNLDYRILEPTFLHLVNANFDYTVDGLASCRIQGVEAIPINTECSDFPWRNGALGASGIGQLTADGGAAFVPSQKENEEFLQCNVTLLDDVVLNAEVFFVSGEAGDRKTKSLNLTELLKSGGRMNLICIPRAPDDVPAGCRPPAS